METITNRVEINGTETKRNNRVDQLKLRARSWKR